MYVGAELLSRGNLNLLRIPNRIVGPSGAPETEPKRFTPMC